MPTLNIIMCLESGTCTAHDFDYYCTIEEDVCATRNLKFEDVIVKVKDDHYFTFSTLKSYENVVNWTEFLENLNKK